MIDRERLITSFLELARIGSESGHEGRLRDTLIEKLASLGISAAEDGAAQVLKGESGNLVARWETGTLTDKPSILFSAHMDTVKPGTGVEPVIEGDIIRSQGNTILGADDKAGIAAILEALRVVGESGLPRPPIEVVFTVNEEQGLMGSKHLDFSRINSRMGFVLDSAGEPGTIITQAPRQNEIEFRVFGKAAHAGINPEDGINAIYVAAKALAGLRIGRIDEETTCNLGIIEGGTARNIVAEFCRIGGEARSISPAKLDQLVRELVDGFQSEVARHGATSEVRVELLYPEMNLHPEEPVVALARRAVENMGKVPRLIKTGGGSDASILNGHGIRCVNLGIGMQKAHTTGEFILIEHLVETARLVVEIIKEAVRQS